MAAKCAAILAGGQSRRFGRDKTALMHHGRLLLAPLVEILHDEKFEITLLGPHKPHLEALGCRFLSDVTPHEGPLPAIAGALSRLNSECLLVVAADMPFLTQEVTRLLWQLSPEAILTRLDGAVLPAVYHRDALPTMTHLIQDGVRRLQDLHAALALHSHVLPADIWQSVDPHRRSLININEPGDWESLCPDCTSGHCLSQ
jgi:molybdopterin-guanine dinucleotide biosynthesis protein A